MRSFFSKRPESEVIQSYSRTTQVNVSVLGSLENLLGRQPARQPGLDSDVIGPFGGGNDVTVVRPGSGLAVAVSSRTLLVEVEA